MKMAVHLLQKPNDVYVETEQGWLSLQDGHKGKWSGNNLEVQAIANTHGLLVTLQAVEEAVKTVKISWNIRTEGKLQVLGDHWERAYGDLEWRGIVPERVMPWYFLTNDGSVTNGYGVLTGPNAFCYWQMDKESVTFTADVRNGNAGVRLEGRRLDVATIVEYQGSSGESSFNEARRFCEQMCEQPVMPSEPVYGGNNWYYAYGNSSHQQILRDSRFISSLAPSAQNRPFMVIDDGWQLASGEGGCKGGPWTGSPLFPDMAGLASEMKEIGVRPGIWCRPLMVSGDVSDEWVRFVTDDNDKVLDPSVPGALAYISESIEQMSNWGYELIKHDFSTYDLLGKWGFQMKADINEHTFTFRDRSRTTAEITLDLYRTIAKASGSSILIGCNTISHLAAGLFEIQRTGDDTSGKSWERTRYMGVNTLAFRMAQHGTFYSHDADCVGITEHVPWELNKEWLDLLAGSGTPLFVSVDPAIVTKEQELALRAAFDLASRELPLGEPLDWMETTCPSRWVLNEAERSFDWNRKSVGALSLNDNHWWL
jgi:alpha-galactosidase